jgi:hypothetical protein
MYLRGSHGRGRGFETPIAHNKLAGQGPFPKGPFPIGEAR